MASLSALIAVLSSLIALCGIVPLFPWLETAPRLALIIGMGAGIWQDRRGAWPIRNWMLNASIVPVFLYYTTQFSRSNAVQPVASVLAIMLAVRLVGEKSGRHYLQIQALSLFCLATSSLFDLSPLFLLYLTLLLLLVPLSLVLLTFYDQERRMALSPPALRRIVAAGLLLPLASLPLLALFFPLLPRTQFPLWNFSTAATARPSGFSDKVEPGTSAVVGDAPLTAFRAELPRQPAPRLYWRGTVFNRLDGNRWVRDPAVPPEHFLYPGRRISQTIYPEPGSRSVIALDAAAAISLPRSRLYPDGVFDSPFAGGKRRSYGAQSVPAGVLPVAGGIDRAFYLRLPPGIPPRITELAAAIHRRGNSDAQRLELIETYFRTNNFRYAMQGLPTGDHALEQFLFTMRQGHCEFFASAYAMLARAAGVPCRLVGGYLGGEYNELGGYYLVTENMAHAWVEAFVADTGWTRIDPSSFAGNADALWGGAPRRDLRLRLRLAIDSFNHAWNRSVITYDFERQITVAGSVGRQLQQLRPWSMLKHVLPYLLLGAGIAGAILLLLNRRIIFPSQEERLVRRFYQRVREDCGMPVEPGRQGLFEIAGATDSSAVQEFVAIYAGAVYRDRRPTSDEMRRMKLLLAKGFARSGGQ